LYSISKNWTTMEWDLYYYVVEKFTVHEKWQQLESGEDIQVERKNKDEILEIIKSWCMQEDRSVGVLMRYLFAS
jgi:methylthioribose-1-phosphate isomerase